MYDLSSDVHNVAQAISGRETYTSETYELAYGLVSEIVLRAMEEARPEPEKAFQFLQMN